MNRRSKDWCDPGAAITTPRASYRTPWRASLARSPNHTQRTTMPDPTRAFPASSRSHATAAAARHDSDPTLPTSPHSWPRYINPGPPPGSSTPQPTASHPPPVALHQLLVAAGSASPIRVPNRSTSTLVCPSTPTHRPSTMSFLTVALASAFMLSTPLLLVDRSELCADAADAPAAVAAANAAAPPPAPIDSACSSPTTDISKAAPPSPSSKRNDSAISMSSVIGRLHPLVPAAGVRAALDEHDEALDMSQDDEPALEISASPRSASPVLASPVTYFPATLMDFGLDQPAVKRVVAPSRRGSMAVTPNAAVEEDATEYSPMLESTYVGIGIPFGI
ncbi:hypothetical protein AMAG_06651 [Allomyces macrogynus ATCC 38327]|uniref:Uncharacterized protein n=1 Tax=Allomyces macrogynus (strain ATCC 38327) TaxID=578462 RepID=A0A0L0SER8_ALLM3|nr:hypothetical protein AMAG_06651 [Allomyces macrogynus ATCC 38327]|eukprot:KNE60890.1 hypothetical protein AMAG_06651 [Allomyces macrogynus ATCC 38327]